jgi:hypothetical protein
VLTGGAAGQQEDAGDRGQRAGDGTVTRDGTE